MATDATPGGIDIGASAATRLLERVRAWQRRLREAVDRHFDARACDVARELHDVVDRLSVDLGACSGSPGCVHRSRCTAAHAIPVRDVPVVGDGVETGVLVSARRPPYDANQLAHIVGAPQAEVPFG